MKGILYTLIFCLFLGCDSRSEIKELIRENTTDNYILASYRIGEKKDTKFIDFLIDDLDDGRISHNIRFKGISVYQSKATALMKISGLKPPSSITHKPDSVVIKFYAEWHKKWRSQVK